MESIKAAIALCLLFPAGMKATAGDADNPGQLNSKDYKFACSAATGGMTEIQLGQIAAQKTANSSVKDFADMMVKDHTDANQQLTQLAAQKGATLPTSISTPEKREIERLQALNGTDFDKAYLNRMVSDHKKAVSEYQQAIKDSRDPDVQTFASKTLPTLQEHLSKAMELATQVVGTSSAAMK